MLDAKSHPLSPVPFLQILLFRLVHSHIDVTLMHHVDWIHLSGAKEMWGVTPGTRMPPRLPGSMLAHCSSKTFGNGLHTTLAQSDTRLFHITHADHATADACTTITATGCNLKAAERRPIVMMQLLARVYTGKPIHHEADTNLCVLCCSIRQLLQDCTGKQAVINE